MSCLVCHCEGALNATQILQTPSCFLPILADTASEDLAFYSMDTEGVFVYLSPSAEQVTSHNPKSWIGRSFREALTESSVNDAIRIGKCNEIDDRPVRSYSFEIFDRGGNRLKLSCWRVQIVQKGRVIGQTGVLQRSPCQLLTADDAIAKSQLLSLPENQVIDLVFEGKLNKSIAKELGVSMRTIESRRSRSMKKLGVKSVSELIQVWAQVKATKAQGD